MLHTLLIQRCKQVCRLFLVQIDGFLVLVLRQNHAAARIGKDKLPLNRCAQHGRNQPVMVQNRTHCQRVLFSGRLKHLIKRELQSRCDLVRTGGIDIRAARYAVQHIHRYTRLFRKRPLGHAALFSSALKSIALQ